MARTSSTGSGTTSTTQNRKKKRHNSGGGGGNGNGKSMNQSQSQTQGDTTPVLTEEEQQAVIESLWSDAETYFLWWKVSYIPIIFFLRR